MCFFIIIEEIIKENGTIHTKVINYSYLENIMLWKEMILL